MLIHKLLFFGLQLQPYRVELLIHLKEVVDGQFEGVELLTEGLNVVALVEDQHGVVQWEVDLVSQVLIDQVVVREDRQVTVGDTRTHQVVGAAVVDLT